MPRVNGLIKLIARLMDEREMRKRLNEEPYFLAEEYEIRNADRTALFTMSKQEVANRIRTDAPALAQEVLNFQLQRLKFEFPPCSDEYEEVVRSEYPTPEPAIYRVRPRETSLADLPGDPPDKEFQLVITGQSFAPDPYPSVRVKHFETGTEWSLPAPSLMGTLRCSRLLARMQTHPDGTGIRIGTYKVIVTNNGTDIWRAAPDKPDFEVVA